MRKPALPGQTSDVSNIQKTKMWCKHAKSSFTRANIRYVKHPKNQKSLQTSENQLYQGEHPICQTSENQKALQTSENQLYHGKHPICQASEKSKGAGNIRKANFPGQTSDMSNIRKTKKCCKHAKTSFTRVNIRYVKHPKNEKVLQTSEKQLFQGKHPISQTSEKPKNAANMQKLALPGQTSDISNIRKTKMWCKHAKTSFTRANIRYVKHSKTKKCCKHPKSSFSRANFRYVKHPKNQKVLQTCENQLYEGKHPICQTLKN